MIAISKTHLCVSATARAPRDLGFRSTVVRSARATHDRPGGRGGGIVAGTVRNTAWADLADAFAATTTVGQMRRRKAGP